MTMWHTLTVYKWPRGIWCGN